VDNKDVIERKTIKNYLFLGHILLLIQEQKEPINVLHCESRLLKYLKYLFLKDMELMFLVE